MSDQTKAIEWEEFKCRDKVVEMVIGEGRVVRADPSMGEGDLAPPPPSPGLSAQIPAWGRGTPIGGGDF